MSRLALLRRVRLNGSFWGLQETAAISTAGNSFNESILRLAHQHAISLVECVLELCAVMMALISRTKSIPRELRKCRLGHHDPQTVGARERPTTFESIRAHACILQITAGTLEGENRFKDLCGRRHPETSPSHRRCEDKSDRQARGVEHDVGNILKNQHEPV